MVKTWKYVDLTYYYYFYPLNVDIFSIDIHSVVMYVEWCYDMISLLHVMLRKSDRNKKIKE